MSTEISEFGDVMSQTIGTQWNNKLIVLVPEEEGKRSFVAKCVHLDNNNKMLIQKKSGEIELTSLNRYKCIRLLKPMFCLEVKKPEVI
jgi:hypothetical protein